MLLKLVNEIKCWCFLRERAQYEKRVRKVFWAVAGRRAPTRRLTSSSSPGGGESGRATEGATLGALAAVALVLRRDIEIVMEESQFKLKCR